MKAITRDSNMELCRIVAMSMICIFHFLCHGIEKYTPETHPFLTILRSLVISGSNLYFFISGYFLIKMSWLKLINFISIIFLFSVINYIALIFTGRHIHVAVFDILLFPISNSNYWFLQVYMMLMILSPLLNKGLEGLDRNSLRTMVILLTIAFSYSCWLGKNFSCKSGLSLLTGLNCYILGYWARHDDIIKKLSIKLLISIFVIGCIVSSLLCSYTDDFIWYDYRSIFVTIISFSVFIIFTKISIKSKTVNYIAGASLYVYLLQDGFFGAKYLYEWERIFFHDHQVWQSVALFAITFVIYWVLAIIAMVIMKKILAIENKLISLFIPRADKRIG